MPKRIVLCFDGTWNTPGERFAGLGRLHAWMDELRGRGAAQMRAALEAVDPGPGVVETNVCRFYRAIRPRPAAPGVMGQLRWYDAGVGTAWYDRVSGGAFGLGLSANIREGYRFLAEAYDPGDEIFVLGFSRGAYTARSLVGMIRNAGLLPRGSTPDGPHGNAMMDAYQLYRTRDDTADSDLAQRFRREHRCLAPSIAFLGVWDTVGALGIPVETARGFNKALFQFHDTELSGIVRNAFHAIALDEHREPYDVTLWDPKRKPEQHMEQRWFSGAHADVGGGYEERALSDVTLAWMQEKAMECGLELDPAGLVTPRANAVVEVDVSDSFGNFLGGAFGFFAQRHYRRVRRTVFGQEKVDATVRERLERNLRYRPRNDGLGDPD